MKYLLKFKIETWGDYIGDDKEYDLTLKVEFIEERVKEEGFFQIGRGHLNESRLLFHFKSCEVIEGPKEVRDLYDNRLRFFLCRKECPDYLVIALEIYENCTEVKFIGFGPVVEDQSKEQ